MTEPGLQAERTALGWSRTSLAFAAVGALLLRAGLLEADLAAVAGSVAAASGALVVTLVARARRRELTAGRVGPPAAARLRLVGGLAAASGLAAAVLVGQRLGS